MKFLARVFASALARRLAYVAVAMLLAWCGLGTAHAATACTGTVPRPCEQGAAYSDAGKQAVDAGAAQCPAPTYIGSKTEVHINQADAAGGYYGSRYMCQNANGTYTNAWGSIGIENAYWQGACTARPRKYAGFVNTTAPLTRCLNGCTYSIGDTIQQDRVDAAPNSSIFHTRGYWKPTGAVCGLTATQLPPANDTYCADLPMGHKMCRDAKGRNCVVSGTTGRKYCPDEAGGPLNSTNDNRTENVTGSPDSPAPGVPPPTVVPRPGEVWTPTVTPSVTNVTNNVTNNFGVNNNTGGPNTNPGDGLPGDGSAGNGDGSNTPDADGDGEDDESGQGAKLSGGLSCDVPPVCDVVDDAACKTGMIQWQLACEGSAEVGSAQANAQIQVDLLEASWDEEAQQYSDGAIQQYNDARNALAEDVQENDEIDFGLLDNSGFLGSATCPVAPSFTVGGTSFAMSFELLCSLLMQMGVFIEAMAYFVALKILTRNA